MEELRDLVNVALSGRINGIETFNHYTENKNSLTYKLFSNIARNKIRTDSEAKMLLYGEKYDGKSYDMLKKRFKEKLYTNVLFVQPRKVDSRSYAHNAYYVHKHYVVAKLLLMIAARKAGRELMEKVFSRSQQYGITEIAMLAAMYLKKEAKLAGDKPLYNRYSDNFHTYLEILKAENDAEEKYDTLIFHFTKSYTSRPDLVPQVKSVCEEITALQVKYDTYLLNQSAFYAQILYSDLTNNYINTLNACNDFEQYLLTQISHYSKVRHGNILLLKLNSLLYLGKYDEGIRLSGKALEMYESSEGNWLILQEIHFLLAIRGEQYELASSIISCVSPILAHRNIDEKQKEIWRIFKGFLWFSLSTLKKNHHRDEIFHGKTFNVSKLANEVSIYTKDKEGIGLSFNILQLCLLLSNRNYEQAIEKIEYIRSYIYTYVNKKEGARDYAMLNLILTLPKFNFHPATIKKHSLILLKKLEGLPIINNAYARTRIEVLPYEKLWHMLVGTLDH